MKFHARRRPPALWSIIKRFEIHLIILSQCKIEARSTTPLNALKQTRRRALARSTTFERRKHTLRYYTFYRYFSPRRQIVPRYIVDAYRATLECQSQTM